MAFSDPPHFGLGRLVDILVEWVLHNAEDKQWFPVAAPCRSNQITVHLSDELERYLLGAHRFTLAMIRATAEEFVGHRDHHAESPLVTLGKRVEVSDFAEVKSMAAVFGRAATQAPQPMQAAARPSSHTSLAFREATPRGTRLPKLDSGSPDSSLARFPGYPWQRAFHPFSSAPRRIQVLHVFHANLNFSLKQVETQTIAWRQGVPGSGWRESREEKTGRGFPAIFLGSTVRPNQLDYLRPRSPDGFSPASQNYSHVRHGGQSHLPQTVPGVTFVIQPMHTAAGGRIGTRSPRPRCLHRDMRRRSTLALPVPRKGTEYARTFSPLGSP